MPGPLVAIAADVGTRLAGAGLSRLIGGKPRVPDLVAPAINSAQATLSDNETAQQRALALANANSARVGGVGFAGNAQREDLLNANARQNALLRGGILDTLTGARQRQELIETDIANRNRENLMAGIQGGFNAAGAGIGDMLAGDPSAALNAPVIGSEPVITPGVASTQSIPQLGLAGQASLANQMSQQLGTFSDPNSSFASQVPQFVPGIGNASDPSVFSRRLFQGLQY